MADLNRIIKYTNRDFNKKFTYRLFKNLFSEYLQ